jgi:transglutaminase-like putative cysteine protease
MLLKTLWISLILCLVISYSGHGQNKNFNINKANPSWLQKVEPKQNRPADKDISDGYFIAFYGNQTHAELKEDYTHLIREIVSDAGVQNGSQISVTYDPGFQKLIFHKVLVWRNGKSSDRLNASAFKFLQSEKDLSRFIYSGTFDALMVLDDVRKGDRIEFSYTLKGFNPIYGKNYTSTIYSEGSSSIGHIYMNVILNKSRKLNIKSFNADPAPKITEKDNLKVYEWENTLTKTHRITDYEPSWYNPLKRTQLSEFSSWSEVVDWGLSVSDYPNLKTPLLDNKVKELKAQSRNIKDYIKLATRFVQDEIRYMGIEVGVYSHRPNSPEKILQQRYGDCKDKSLLLVKILQANGINAYLTYADSYGSTYKNDYLPSPFIFNHVIVAIDYSNYRTWVDPTIAYQRGGFDDFYAPNYGNVLVLKKGVNALEMIESKPIGKLISEMKFKMADTASGAKTTLLVHSVYTSNYADDMRSEIAGSGTDDLQKRFLEYFTKMYPEIEVKDNLVIKDDEDSNTLEITESYEISDIWTEGSKPDIKFAYFYGDLVSTELRTIKGKKRVQPIALKHAVNIEQNITVLMPYAVTMGQDNFHIDRDGYFFDVYMNQVDSTIKFNYTYRNAADHIPENKIQEYLNDVKKIDEYLSYTVNYGVSSSSTAGLSFYMIFPYLLTLVAAGFLFSRLYFKQSAFDIVQISEAIPIGGWLAVIAIRIVILPISLLINPFSSDLFSTQYWYNLGNITGTNEIAVKAFFIVEIIFCAALFAYSVFCLILFFQKRKELPGHYIKFSILGLIFLIYDTTLTTCIEIVSNMDSIALAKIPGLIWSIITYLFFIGYFLKSERVKQTFVYTYPKFEWKSALDRYFEELSFKKDTPIETLQTEIKTEYEETGEISPISEKEN